MKIRRRVLAVFAFCLAVGAPAAEALNVLWPGPVEIMQGEIVELQVSGEGLAEVEGRLDKDTVYFHPTSHGLFTAIVGADLEAKPGASTLVLTAKNRSGTQSRRDIAIKIKAKAFRKESFTVPETFDRLGPEVLERIRRERADFALAFAASTAERLWEPPFIRPVPHESSSSFGYRRIINGKARTPHSGADLRSPVGTEVLATNHGRVVLLGDYFFSGKSIVLHHGGGLHTMYFHLADFKVEAGAIVRRGEVIALSGMSGRVTGPHLHWGARLGSARVDPFDLIHKISETQSQ